MYSAQFEGEQNMQFVNDQQLLHRNIYTNNEMDNNQVSWSTNMKRKDLFKDSCVFRICCKKNLLKNVNPLKKIHSIQIYEFREKWFESKFGALWMRSWSRLFQSFYRNRFCKWINFIEKYKERVIAV